MAEIAATIAVVTFVTFVNRSPASFAVPVLFAAVVYIFSFDAGAVSRLLHQPPAQSLGRWSYSIYMVHGLIAFCIGLAASEAQRRYHIELWTPIVDDGIPKRVIASDHVALLDLLHAAYAATVVVLAAMSYRYIEEPARLYFRALAERLDPHGEATKAALPLSAKTDRI